MDTRIKAMIKIAPKALRPQPYSTPAMVYNKQARQSDFKHGSGLLTFKATRLVLLPLLTLLP